MEFTGERFVPSLTGEIKYEHIHRYALSRKLVQGKCVLDLASGEGYGAAILANVAQSVIGVDIDPETVEYAQKNYSFSQNIKFLIGSCDSVPLPDNSVDVVTSFETLEHHGQHEAMMLEIKRVLKPDGILIISTPDRLNYSDKPNYSNPYHVKELYSHEFEELLIKHFAHVKFYGQKLATGSFVFSLENNVETGFQAYTGGVNNLSEQVCSLDSPIYLLAICSDDIKQIKMSVDSIYIDKEDDLLEGLQNSMRALDEQWQKQWQESQTQLQQTQTEWEKTQHLLQQTQTEWEKTQHLLRQAQEGWGEAQTIIKAMESSKFWKLRGVWFKLKQTIGLKAD